jgi:hypothetical protein
MHWLFLWDWWLHFGHHFHHFHGRHHHRVFTPNPFCTPDFKVCADG